jgi:hypothetical protein
MGPTPACPKWASSEVVHCQLLVLQYDILRTFGAKQNILGYTILARATLQTITDVHHVTVRTRARISAPPEGSQIYETSGLHSRHEMLFLSSRIHVHQLSISGRVM